MKYRDTIKRILKEGKESDDITRIAVFDFDGTLVNSPLPDEGKMEYEEKTGQKWPYGGWWGRAESLDGEIFDIQTIPSVISDYRAERKDPNTLVVMLTGRIKRLAPQVEQILSDNNIDFDEYHYNDGGSTLTFKINVLNQLLSEHPNVTSIKLWEDRVEHADSFKAWGGTLKNIDFDITVVGSN